MDKEQVIELLELLEKAQRQKLDREYEHGARRTSINWSWVKDSVEEYKEPTTEQEDRERRIEIQIDQELGK